MASLAQLPELVGFFSYSREDDKAFRGSLWALRDAIQRELSALLGRNDKNFRLWQDQDAIAPGEMWEAAITSAIEQSVFFIPIVTPRAVKSKHCKFEFESFLARERALGRSDLVFPIHYILVPACWTRRSGATIRCCRLSPSANMSTGASTAAKRSTRPTSGKRSRSSAARSSRSCAHAGCRRKSACDRRPRPRGAPRTRSAFGRKPKQSDRPRSAKGCARRPWRRSGPRRKRESVKRRSVSEKLLRRRP